MPHRDKFKQIKLIYLIFQTLVLFANIVQIYHFGSLMGLQIYYITDSISNFSVLSIMNATVYCNKKKRMSIKHIENIWLDRQSNPGPLQL